MASTLNNNENSNNNTSAVDGSSLLDDNRDLRRRCAELELSLRRTNRENIQFKQDAVNHTLLQSQLAALKADTSTNKDVNKTLLNVQKALEGLEQEKLHWSVMFKNINLKQQEMMNTAANSAIDMDGGGIDLEFTADPSEEVTPETVLLAYSKLQQQYAVLLTKTQKACTASSESKRSLRSLQQDYHEVNVEHSKLQKQLDEKSDQLQKYQLKAALYDSEITSLRGLVSSYESELSMGKPDVTKAFAAQEKLLSAMRGQLDVQRKQLGELLVKDQNKLPTGAGADTNANANTSGVDIALLEANMQNEALTSELKAQKDEKAALIEYQYHLQCSVGVDYIPAKTKILHFVNNPYQEVCSTNPELNERYMNANRAAGGSNRGDSGAGSGIHSTIPNIALKAFKQENATLKTSLATALATAASTSASAADSSMNMSLNGSVMENTATATALASAVKIKSTAPSADSNKLNQRLKEMFRDRIQTFREGVYLLTGWKVDLIYDNDSSSSGNSSSSKRPKLRMRSMYAETPDDSLLFQWCGASGDRLDLLDTDFARKLDPLVLQNLTQYNSVPQFLSAVTNELFESQTFMP